MGFRTLELCSFAEIHVRKGQLEITNDEGTVLIPLEDLTTIICTGANIRMSTMAQSQIAEAGISLMIILFIRYGCKCNTTGKGVTLAIFKMLFEYWYE